MKSEAASAHQSDCPVRTNRRLNDHVGQRPSALPGISPDEYESSDQKPDEKNQCPSFEKRNSQAGYQKSSATKPVGKNHGALNHMNWTRSNCHPVLVDDWESAAQYIPPKTLEEPKADFSDSDPQPAVKTRKPLPAHDIPW